RSRELADHDRVGRSFRHDGAHADAEVEDATKLDFLDALVGEPPEDAGALPSVPVDSSLEPVGHYAGQVPDKTAAGHVGQTTNVCALLQLADLFKVQRVRREQQIRIEVAVADERPDEREAVRVQPTRAKADDHVARLAAGPVDDAIALDEPDARSGEV